MNHTRDFAEVVRSQLADDPELAFDVEAEVLNSEIASQVYAARKAAGLSQKQLADLVGTKQSVISRIEDADYDGRTLNSLLKLALAMNMTLKVELQPKVIADQVVAVEWMDSHLFSEVDDVLSSGVVLWGDKFTSSSTAIAKMVA